MSPPKILYGFRSIHHQCTLSTQLREERADICLQTSRRALNRIFVEPEATSSAELPFIFRFIPALSPSTTDEKNAKHTSTLRLAVDAENMFRAVFVFYVCVVGSLSLAGVWAFYRAVRSIPMVGV
jgi:hypothetical protein